MIRFENVSKVFGSGPAAVRAVDDVSFNVAPGETLCLIGTSGSGKTTALRMINRLDAPSTGTISVEESPVGEQDIIRLRRRIGYVIQRGGLFPHMTVSRNIALLGELEGHPPEQAKARTDELLRLVGLDPAAHGPRFPSALSGGQQQRVSVARALYLDPPIVLLDEPFGALDPLTRSQLHREFLAIKRDLKKTMVLVTHDMAEAFLLGDRIGVMDAGSLVQLADATTLRQKPATPFVEALIASHQGGT